MWPINSTFFQASVYLGSKENMLFSGLVALVSATMARFSLES